MRGSVLAMVALVALAAHPDRSEAQGDAAVDTTSRPGRLSDGGAPIGLDFRLIRAPDTPPRLQILIADDVFETTSLELGPNLLEFDWIPGESQVSCELAAGAGVLDGECTDEEGGAFGLRVDGTFDVQPDADPDADADPEVDSVLEADDEPEPDGDVGPGGDRGPDVDAAGPSDSQGAPRSDGTPGNRSDARSQPGTLIAQGKAP